MRSDLKLYLEFELTPSANRQGARMTLATHNIADVADLGAKVVNPFAKAK